MEAGRPVVKRGEIRWFRKRRPVLILTRDSMIPLLGELVVGPVTTTVRGVASEVMLDESDGMPRVCAVNVYHLRTVAKGDLGALVATLPARRWPDVRRALLYALGFEP